MILSQFNLSFLLQVITLRHLQTLMLPICLLLIHSSEQFPRSFSTKILHVFHIFPILATYTAHCNTTR